MMMMSRGEQNNRVPGSGPGGFGTELGSTVFGIGSKNQDSVATSSGAGS